MLFKRKNSLKVREEIGTPENIKFIEPRYYKKDGVNKDKIIFAVFFIVLFFLLTRLFFMEGGIIELFSKKTAIQEKLKKIDEIRKL